MPLESLTDRSRTRSRLARVISPSIVPPRESSSRTSCGSIPGTSVRTTVSLGALPASALARNACTPGSSDSQRKRPSVSHSMRDSTHEAPLRMRSCSTSAPATGAPARSSTMPVTQAAPTMCTSMGSCGSSIRNAGSRICSTGARTVIHQLPGASPPTTNSPLSEASGCFTLSPPPWGKHSISKACTGWSCSSRTRPRSDSVPALAAAGSRAAGACSADCSRRGEDSASSVSLARRSSSSDALARAAAGGGACAPRSTNQDASPPPRQSSTTSSSERQRTPPV